MTPSISWPVAIVLLGVLALFVVVVLVSPSSTGQILTLLAGAAAGWLAPSPLASARPKDAP